jgi:hypothetical protein
MKEAASAISAAAITGARTGVAVATAKKAIW